jgi:hypothetical protein
MQSPEVDLSAFDDEVTFREPDPCSGSKLLEDTLEPLLRQWWYFMGQKVLLWGSTGYLRNCAIMGQNILLWGSTGRLRNCAIMGQTVRGYMRRNLR